MKKNHCATWLLVSFLPCCGPQPESAPTRSVDSLGEPSKINDAGLLPFKEIRAPDLAAITSQENRVPDIEQWRFIPQFKGHWFQWYQLTPFQTYYYDWLEYRKVNRRRVYPW